MTVPDADFEALLAFLKEGRGFDFTGYKRATLTRRVGRRMAQLGVESYGDYLDYLQVHPEEFAALFNTILINVTEFFRDAAVWDFLRAEVIPQLLAGKGPTDPIRVWTAGCASGQEAYSVVIQLCEVLGADAFKERVKFYATDVDEEALVEARHATYTLGELRNVPAQLVERYFEQHGQRFTFRKDLRRAVIIGRNDLVQDAPISRIDLLVCRNVLMYFNSDTQARILRRFHFALSPAGVLCLGKAEMLLGHSDLFTPVDMRLRVFRKAVPQLVTDELGPVHPSDGKHSAGQQPVERLCEEAILSGPTPQIVITTDGQLAAASQQAEALFGLSARDLGRPFRDLQLYYRPIELRSYIERAQLDRRTVRVRDVEYLRGADRLNLEIQITPLQEPDGTTLGVSIVFQDVTEAFRLRADLQNANRQLELAYEELQSTNEELETTNEELQSTVEELETTNEELQSTNEELETMNEELHSANDELQTINDELRERTDQVNDANGFLASVLDGLRAGVAVLDRDLRIQTWNRPAEDLWGLRGEEAVHRHFLKLDIGLPVERLRNELWRALADGGDFEVLMKAVNRFGRHVEVRVVGNALRREGDVRGVVLVMDVVTPPAADESSAEG